jgi:hypothetical protein
VILIHVPDDDANLKREILYNDNGSTLRIRRVAES